MEPTEGGRWFERGEDGSECEWGRVATWRPHSEVVLIWQLSAEWRYDPDLETPVEVRFTVIDDATTRVDLRHRHLERFGDRSEEMAAALGSANGWSTILAGYAAHAG